MAFSIFIIGIIFFASILLINYLTVTNYYYPSYSDIDPVRFERDYFPREMPTGAFDIHKQIDGDMGVTWIRFQASEDDKDKMVINLRKLTPEEINPGILFFPARDVDWWFDNLRQIEPDDENLDADIFVTEECAGLLETGYIALDKDSLNVYYWCR